MCARVRLSVKRSVVCSKVTSFDSLFPFSSVLSVVLYAVRVTFNIHMKCHALSISIAAFACDTCTYISIYMPIAPTYIDV